MSNYKVLQLTNNNIGAVAIETLLPLGIITRKICYGNADCRTFELSTTNSNTVTLNTPGNYRITFNGSLVASAAGEVSISLIANGVSVYTTSVTAGAADDIVNLTLPYEVRVCPNCSGNPNNCPMTIQFELTGTAITGGTSNILIEKVY